MNALITLVSDAFPWFFPVLAFVFGAIVGSFLNVVIFRLPKGESLVHPGSHCGCGKPIRFYDNIPILSWLILRGRARCCKAHISIRYPLVELLTALLFLACWMMFPPLLALCYFLFVAVLICATFIDIDHMIIPDRFSIGLALVGVLLSMFIPALHGIAPTEIPLVAHLRSTLISLAGVLVASGLLIWIAVGTAVFLKKETMGFGDVKLIGGIGAFLGWEGAVFAIFSGAFVGLLWYAIWTPIKKHKKTSKETAPENTDVEISFGPMLAAGALIYLFYAHAWVDKILLPFKDVVF